MKTFAYIARSIPTWFLTSIFVLLCGLAGCSGGGTGGTGVRSYQGTLRTTSQAPIAGAQVTILETGDSATTDADGNFIIETDDAIEDVQLLVEGQNFSSTVPVQDIPAEDNFVQVELELDENTKSVTPKSVEHEKKDKGKGENGSDDRGNGGSSGSDSNGGSSEGTDDGNAGSGNGNGNGNGNGHGIGNSDDKPGNGGQPDSPGGGNSGNQGNSGGGQGGGNSGHGNGHDDDDDSAEELVTE